MLPERVEALDGLGVSDTGLGCSLTAERATVDPRRMGLAGQDSNLKQRFQRPL